MDRPVSYETIRKNKTLGEFLPKKEEDKVEKE